MIVGTPFKRMLINYPHTSNIGAELICKHEIMQYGMGYICHMRVELTFFCTSGSVECSFSMLTFLWLITGEFTFSPIHTSPSYLETKRQKQQHTVIVGTPLKRMLINYPHTSNLEAELICKHEIMQYGMATYEGGAGFLDQLFHVLSVPAVRMWG